MKTTLAILTALDQTAFFPSVTQTGAALQALCALAQSHCEGMHGANRPLDLTTVTEVSPVRSPHTLAVARLSLFPVMSVTSVEVRSSAEDFARSLSPDWTIVNADAYRFELTTNEIHLNGSAVEMKATYTAGYNFTSTTHPDVQKIKAIAGALLVHFANNFYGAYDSYFAQTPTVSINYASLDAYIKALLQPLRCYVPRASGGMYSV